MSTPTFLNPEDTHHGNEVPYATNNTSLLPQNNDQKNCCLTSGDDHHKDSSKGKELGALLWIYAAPVIFCIGVCGNIFILLIMRRRRMSGTTTSVYLRLMAIADLCVLIVGMIPEWLEAMNIVEFKEISPVTCKLEKFLLFTVSDTAIWILVVFTLDRFHALVFPFSKLEMCQPTRAKYNAFIVFLLASVKNFHMFWTRGSEYKMVGNESVWVENCGKPTEVSRYFENYIRPWIVFALVNVLPFCILLFCNVFIIRVLISVKKMQNHQAIVTSKDKTLVQMSLMCLSASFCFLICITPSIVLLIGKPYWTERGRGNEAYDIAKAINNQLTYINHSANFFLYCVTGKRFRRELLSVLKCHSGSQGSPLGSTDSKSYVYRFNTRSPNRSPTHAIRNYNGAVRYYKMDQGTGKMAPDHSPDHLNMCAVTIASKTSP